eukprot:gene10915-7997_t
MVDGGGAGARRAPWRVRAACHGCEIPFVFNRKDSSEYGINGTGELALGRAMSAYWTNFAWTGDPSKPGSRTSTAAGVATQWPHFSAGTLRFDATEDAA